MKQDSANELEISADVIVIEGEVTDPSTAAEIRANLIWSKGALERGGLVVSLDEETQAFVDRRRRER
jgi:hypothetical protein